MWQCSKLVLAQSVELYMFCVLPTGSRGNHPVATDDDGGPSPAENGQ